MIWALPNSSHSSFLSEPLCHIKAESSLASLVFPLTNSPISVTCGFSCQKGVRAKFLFIDSGSFPESILAVRSMPLYCKAASMFSFSHSLLYTSTSRTFHASLSSLRSLFFELLAVPFPWSRVLCWVFSANLFRSLITHVIFKHHPNRNAELFAVRSSFSTSPRKFRPDSYFFYGAPSHQSSSDSVAASPLPNRPFVVSSHIR